MLPGRIVIYNQITFNLTIAGTVESFNATDYRHRLAAAVIVPVRDITLQVYAASVIVVAHIAAAEANATTDIVSTLSALVPLSAIHTASTILGVQVESVQPVITYLVTAPLVVSVPKPPQWSPAYIPWPVDPLAEPPSPPFPPEFTPTAAEPNLTSIASTAQAVTTDGGSESSLMIVIIVPAIAVCSCICAVLMAVLCVRRRRRVGVWWEAWGLGVVVKPLGLSWGNPSRPKVKPQQQEPAEPQPRLNMLPAEPLQQQPTVPQLPRGRRSRPTAEPLQQQQPAESLQQQQLAEPQLPRARRIRPTAEPLQQHPTVPQLPRGRRSRPTAEPLQQQPVWHLQQPAELLQQQKPAELLQQQQPTEPQLPPEPPDCRLDTERGSQAAAAAPAPAAHALPMATLAPTPLPYDPPYDTLPIAGAASDAKMPYRPAPELPHHPPHATLPIAGAASDAEMLQRAAPTMHDVETGGLVPAQLKQEQSRAKDLLGAGFSLGVMREKGFTVQELKVEQQFSAAQLSDAGFSMRDICEGGYTAAQLRSEGFGAVSLCGAGYQATQLLDAGFSVRELKGEFSLTELKRENISAAQLKTAGFTAQQLKAEMFSAEELKGAGFQAAELKSVGCSAGELVEAGFGSDELCAAGFTAWDMQIAGHTASQLKELGYEVGSVRKLFAPEDLETLGTSSTPEHMPQQPMPQEVMPPEVRPQDSLELMPPRGHAVRVYQRGARLGCTRVSGGGN